MKKAYHISPRKIRRKILSEGLKPILGPRSRRFGEFEPKLFLTSNLEDSINLTKKKIFNSHPDFREGMDIWEVNIPETMESGNDKKYDLGFYVKHNVGLRDISLIKSLKWTIDKN